jgi:hypothetical protein
MSAATSPLSFHDVHRAMESAAMKRDLVVYEGEGFTQARYEKDGRLDFETYRRVQNESNRLKLSETYARPDIIDLVCQHARKHIPRVGGILCHGVGNGAELTWFGERFPRVELLGTDIADSATSFPNTIQWDFHHGSDHWYGQWSVVYTNAWDHAMEPVRAFRAWAESLHRGGILYLEYGPLHGVSGTDQADLFSADRAVLSRMVANATGLVPMEPVKRMFSRRAVLPFRKPVRIAAKRE